MNFQHQSLRQAVYRLDWASHQKKFVVSLTQLLCDPYLQSYKEIEARETLFINSLVLLDLIYLHLQKTISTKVSQYNGAYHITANREVLQDTSKYQSNLYF